MVCLPLLQCFENFFVIFSFDLESGYHRVDINSNFWKYLGVPWRFSGFVRYFVSEFCLLVYDRLAIYSLECLGHSLHVGDHSVFLLFCILTMAFLLADLLPMRDLLLHWSGLTFRILVGSTTKISPVGNPVRLARENDCEAVVCFDQAN